MTRESGILFTRENRDKVRSGDKTQTRRIAKPPIESTEMCPVMIMQDAASPSGYSWHSDMYGTVHAKPRHQVGDLLYLREPYHLKGVDDDSCDVIYFDDCGTPTYVELDIPGTAQMLKIMRRDAERFFLGYHPSIHMPKVLARTWVKVTGVKVERVGEINEVDALAEGVVLGSSAMGHAFTAKELFRALWNSINEKPKPVTSKGVITHYESSPWDDSGKYAKMKTYRGKPHLCYPNPHTFAYTFELTEREQR